MGNSLKPYEFPDEASGAFELDAPEPREAAVDLSSGSWHARLRDPRRLLVAACLVVACAAAGTFAWLSATGVLANQFGIGIVQPSVSETLDGAVKSDVRLTNDGSTPAYMRAQVDIYWQDDGGARLWDEPVAGTDYEIIWSSDVGWSQGPDGFWYWNTAVAPLGQTGVLLKSVSSASDAEDRHLIVDVSSQAIQANPADAVRQAWGCTVQSDGSLVPPSAGGGE